MFISQLSKFSVDIVDLTESDLNWLDILIISEIESLCHILLLFSFNSVSVLPLNAFYLMSMKLNSKSSSSIPFNVVINKTMIAIHTEVDICRYLFHQMN